jgi:hypothetical protein
LIVGAEIALERDHALDAVEHPLLGFTFGTVGGVDPTVAQPDYCARQRQFLALGIEP